MKRNKIGIIFGVLLIGLTNIVNAKYVYYFEETIIELKRDSSLPICQVRYSTEEETNQNVVVTITSNKQIEQVSGFELSEDKKTLTKVVSENETQTIKIRDFSGNCTEVEYNVNYIDKEFPQIIGCENGGVYKGPVSLEYHDNSGIAEVQIDHYDEHLDATAYKINGNLAVSIKAHPLNTKKYRYYIKEELYSTVTESTYIFTGLEAGMEKAIKVEALDEDGKVLDTIAIEEICSNFEEKESVQNYSEHELVKKGNYQIKVTDFAGNETIYQIKVK